MGVTQTDKQGQHSGQWVSHRQTDRQGQRSGQGRAYCELVMNGLSESTVDVFFNDNSEKCLPSKVKSRWNLKIGTIKIIKPSNHQGTIKILKWMQISLQM